MKTYRIKLLPVLLLLLIAGCKKETEFKTAPAVTKSITQTPSGNSIIFAYDAAGRLMQKTNSDGSNLVVTYSGDSALTETYNKIGAIVSYYRVLKLDSTTGFATQGIELDSAGQLKGYVTFAYDWAGRRTLEQLTDTNLNVLQKTEYTYNDEGDITGQYVTDNEKPENTCQYYFSQYYIEQRYTLTTGQPYNGKNMNRLLKSKLRFNNTLGNVFYTFTYTFDEFNRVATESAFDHNQVLKYTNTYTYN